MEGVLRFPMAPMDGRLALLGLPAVVAPGLLFVLASWLPHQADVLGSLGAVLVMLGATVWLFLHPTQVRVDDRCITVEFPMRAVELPRRDLLAVEMYDQDGFRTRFGGGTWFRLGPLLGGLGWLPTSTETFEAYVSNVDTVVVLLFRNRRPVIVTPADATRFMARVQPARRDPSDVMALSTTR